MELFSACHWVVRLVSSARLSARSRWRRPRRSLDASSLSLDSAISSISRRRTARSSSSMATGRLSISIRSRDAASSTRSIALSGRNRPLTYRSERVAAATRAASVMRTPWCTSYRSLRPRRIPMVSSVEGSPTRTGWNRRSRAGSFSMRVRYSLRVVAPIMRSSPRASMGLSMLPASMAPSAAPAPTTVCSSSMNVISRPSADRISLRTARSRSSNSPRSFDPATIDPRSSDTMRRLRRDSGTSPATTRSASPSTIAVLPTPGSPMRTGLFFVRLDRTCTTRRISASRPITGSSLPARACSVRSTENLSNAR